MHTTQGLGVAPGIPVGMLWYSEDSQHIPADIPFIQKPAKLEDLSAKLRHLLDPALTG